MGPTAETQSIPVSRVGTLSVAVTVPVLAGIILLAAYGPLVAAAGVVVLGVLVLTFLYVEVPLHLLIATVPLEAAFSFGDSPFLSASKLAGALCFISFMFWWVVTGVRVSLDRTHALLFCLLGLAMLSTLQARSVSQGAEITFRYAGFVALYLVLSQLAGDRRVLTRAVWVLSLASAASAVIGLARYFGGADYTASLPYNNQNDFAYVLATTLPLAFWLLGSKWIQRAAVAVMIGVMAAAVVLSFSRGAMLGLAAGLAWHIATQPRRLRLLAASIIAAVILLSFVQLNQRRFDESLLVKNRVAQENVDTRFLLWGAATRLTADNPLLGVGPGNFSLYFYESTDSPLGVENLRVVHNAYLDIAAELGLPALALFVAYLAIIFKRASRAVRLKVGPPGHAAAVRIALVVAIVASLTLSEQYYGPLWILGALATAVYRGAGEPEGNRS